MRVLGVPIDNVPRDTVLEQVKTWLAGDTFHRIATVNPEFLLLADQNPNFCQALLAADLRLADGVGLHLPFWLSGEKLIGHFPGADLLHEILKIAEVRGYPVAFALHEHGLSTPLQILAVTKEKYPKLVCSVIPAQAGIQGLDSRRNLPDSWAGGNDQGSNASKLLLCNFGAPMQELYLESLRNKNTGIRLAMGVGGAFDFLTGAVPRAPKVFRSCGLEWLWRLIQQPRRFRRIWNAVVVFPVKVLSQK